MMGQEIENNLETLDLKENQQITPWEVKGATAQDGTLVKIDYDKLMNQFGTEPITAELIERFERLTKRKAHLLLRRKVFFSHRDFSKILDLYEAGQPFYLYTGRGPSSESMHLGHAIPFIFCQYLQEVFQVHLVIQMTDDEKFLWKDLSFADAQAFGRSNAKDIVAFGFDPKLTFIFFNSTYYGKLFPYVVQISKYISFNTARAVFGFDEKSSIGQIHYPAAQIAPCFPDVFPHLFIKEREDVKNRPKCIENTNPNAKKKIEAAARVNLDIPCFVPMAIDQDPYFRLARDIAAKLNITKPAVIHSKFFPALQGEATKMSASDENSAIYLEDNRKKVSNKLNKFAFSGGRETLELHRQFGGNPHIDVAFLYLGFFLDDDEELQRIEKAYASGEMLTGELKARCADVVSNFLEAFQKRRAEVTDEVLNRFLSTEPRE